MVHAGWERYVGLPDIDGSLEVGRTSGSARSHTGADAAHGVAAGRMVRALQTVAGGSSPPFAEDGNDVVVVQVEHDALGAGVAAQDERCRKGHVTLIPEIPAPLRQHQHIQLVQLVLLER